MTTIHGPAGERNQQGKRYGRGVPGRLILAGVCVLALGITLGAVLLPVAAPTSVVGKSPAATAPVTVQRILDPLSVSVAVTSASQPPLTTSDAGTVTRSLCTTGGTAASGAIAAAVDDRPVIYLATDQPLWRDLSIGQSGPDVMALQKELARLGYRTVADGTFGRSTLGAVIQLAKKVGDPTASSWTTFPLQQFVWLPAPSVVTLSCGLQRGAEVSPGATVATLPASIVSAAIEPLPSNVVPGPRVLDLGSVTIPITATGQITGQANLQALAASSLYQQYLAGQSPAGSGSAADSSTTVTGSDSSNSRSGDTLTAQYQLASALSVTVISPAALYDQAGEKACIKSGTATIAVTVVGSQLGESYVTLPPGQAIRQVSLNVRGAPGCR